MVIFDQKLIIFLEIDHLWRKLISFDQKSAIFEVKLTISIRKLVHFLSKLSILYQKWTFSIKNSEFSMKNCSFSIKMGPFRWKRVNLNQILVIVDENVFNLLKIGPFLINFRLKIAKFWMPTKINWKVWHFGGLKYFFHYC